MKALLAIIALSTATVAVLQAIPHINAWQAERRAEAERAERAERRASAECQALADAHAKAIEAEKAARKTFWEVPKSNRRATWEEQMSPKYYEAAAVLARFRAAQDQSQKISAAYKRLQEAEEQSAKAARAANVCVYGW